MSINSDKETFTYCWLDINTGKFSNTWDEKQHEIVDDEMLEIAIRDNWKLIKYVCLTDNAFEFSSSMVLNSKWNDK
jgi:hypothetical protein